MLKKERIHDVINSAIIDANSKYLKWTGNCDINRDGVEHLLSVVIADRFYSKLVKENGGFVSLETSIKELSEKSGAKIIGRRPCIISGKGRIDIVYWDNKDKPVGIIEVKRYLNNRHPKKDILRTATIIRKFGNTNGGSLKIGIIAAMRRENKKNIHDIKKRLGDIKVEIDNMKKYKSSCRVKYKNDNYNEKGNSGYYACSIMINNA